MLGLLMIMLIYDKQCNISDQRNTYLPSVQWKTCQTGEVKRPQLLLSLSTSIHYFPLNLYSENLDNSQREAVEFAIQRSDLAVVHGPPGTGKTTTIVEVIRQHVKLKSKVCFSFHFFHSSSMDSVIQGSFLLLAKVWYMVHWLWFCLFIYFFMNQL